jgi:hypothetical protein
MAQQTSVEWVLQYLNNVKPNEFCSIEKIKELLEQAKEMHKEEIKNAWISAWKDSMINPLEDKYYEPESENYYNETFNK